MSAIIGFRAECWVRGIGTTGLVKHWNIVTTWADFSEGETAVKGYRITSTIEPTRATWGKEWDIRMSEVVERFAPELNRSMRRVERMKRAGEIADATIDIPLRPDPDIQNYVENKVIELMATSFSGIPIIDQEDVEFMANAIIEAHRIRMLSKQPPSDSPAVVAHNVFTSSETTIEGFGAW